jgi:hypothetical protein
MLKTIIQKTNQLLKIDKELLYGMNWNSGGFVLLNDNNIYLFYNSLYELPKKKTSNTTLLLDAKSSPVYLLWVLTDSFSAISHRYSSGINFKRLLIPLSHY